jgi:CRISPR-associated endonuclease Csn1
MSKKKILGLDLGTNSIGWAILEKGQSEGEIIDMGVRIFPAGVDNLGDGDREISKNASRRDARQTRRQGFRRKLRKRILLKALAQQGMCPISEETAESLKAADNLIVDENLKEWFCLNPYELRSRGIKERISLLELGRVLYHFSQRRGFQTNSRDGDEDGTIFSGVSETGKTGIKETDELISSGTLGSYLNTVYPLENESYQAGLPRIRNRYTTRQMYIDEFEAIWECQSKYHNELNHELKELFGGRKKEPQYKKDGILFFQRPLRSQKHTVGKCHFEPTKAKCPISAIEFELFRIHQFINTIEYNGSFLNEEERRIVLGDLLKKEKPKFKAIRKSLKLHSAEFKFNYKDDDVCPGSYTISQLSGKKFFGESWFNKSVKEQRDIWHILFSFDDKEKLVDYARKNWGFDQDQQKNISKFNLKKDYSNLSLKAINNILPFLELGYGYDVAVALGGVKNVFGGDWENLSDSDRDFIVSNVPSIVHSNLRGGYIDSLRQVLMDEFGVDEKRLSKLYHHSTSIHVGDLLDKLPVSGEADHEIQSIRNPVVIQGLFELRKLVNCLIDEYGKPDIIKIELARDLKNSKSKRREIRLEQKKLEQVNQHIVEKLTHYGIRPTHNSILKYKLWCECEKICPYTGRSISFEQLFGGSGEVQIEHIFPWSRSLDDSFMNKTLCFADVNREKGDRTPYEYFSQKFGNEKWEEVKSRALSLFYDVRQLPDRYFPNRYAKYKRFIAKKFNDDFVSRQLNDTRYISKEASNYLKKICSNVQVAPGLSTATLRHHWGLNSILSETGEKTRDDHRHHAIDALVMACTERTHLQELSRINQYSSLNEISSVDDPWGSFRKQAESFAKQILVSHKVNKKVISVRQNYTKKNGRIYSNLGISARGQLHKETVYGKPMGLTNIYHVRKPLESITTSTHVSKIVDDRIRNLIEGRINSLGGYKGKNVPKDAFFSYDDYGNRIPLINLPNRNGDPVPVLKVRVKEVLSNAEQLHEETNGYVNPNSNHHVLIYKDFEGELKESIVSFWAAAERKLQKQEVFQLPSDGSEIVATIAENEMFLIDKSGEITDWVNLPRQEISRYLYRCQNISSGYYVFRLHLASSIQDDSQLVRITSFSAWKRINPIQVNLDIRGEVHFRNA